MTSAIGGGSHLAKVSCRRAGDTILCVGYNLIGEDDQTEFPLFAENFTMNMTLDDLAKFLENQNSIMPDLVDLEVSNGKVELVIVEEDDDDDYED